MRIFLNYRNNLIGQDDHATNKLEDVSKEQEEGKQGCKELLEVPHLNIKRLKAYHSRFLLGVFYDFRIWISFCNTQKITRTWIV